MPRIHLHQTSSVGVDWRGSGGAAVGVVEKRRDEEERLRVGLFAPVRSKCQRQREGSQSVSAQTQSWMSLGLKFLSRRAVIGLRPLMAQL